MSGMQHIGAWSGGTEAPAFDGGALLQAAQRIREPAHVIQDPATGRLGVAFGGHTAPTNGGPAWPVLASLPAIYPEWLGDRGFCEAHGLRFPYVGGAMANGIATTQMVIALASAGCLGFFGAAGLGVARTSAALDALDAALGDHAAWGSNLIHSPNEPALEEAIADLYIRRGVRRVSASAYMKLTPSIVRLSASGLRQLPDGSIHRQHFVFAKISRPEVARHFMAPPPAKMLQALVQAGKLTADEARLAAGLPVAEDIIVESDSGGHTDNQTLTALFPTILRLRDQLAADHGLTRAIRVGAAGGLGTPSAVAAAFALGAAFVLTGSVNQACVESGLHESGRVMLAKAGLADVTMAPAADMFELGVDVQVLKRGTMFAARARRLYDTYRSNAGLEALDARTQTWLERDILQSSLADAWASTRAWWSERDPAEVTRADADPKHRMALVFRAYLGQASRWAISGQADRALDYQIWCGPAMGAFNAWTDGTFLAEPAARTVVQVARNLIEGAAVAARAQQLRSFGVAIPAAAFDYRPRPLA